MLQLAIVWISHMHADHHLGLLHLLEQRAALKPDGPPLLVIGPQALRRWMKPEQIQAPSPSPWPQP